MKHEMAQWKCFVPDTPSFCDHVWSRGAVHVRWLWSIWKSPLPCTHFITTRKWSLQRLCFYMCLSVILFMGGGVSQHALQVVSQHALQVFSGGGGVSQYALGELEESGQGGLQAHTQGGSWGVWPGGVSRPTPGGGVSRPTPTGSPGPHPFLLQCILV